MSEVEVKDITDKGNEDKGGIDKGSVETRDDSMDMDSGNVDGVSRGGGNTERENMNDAGIGNSAGSCNSGVSIENAKGGAEAALSDTESKLLAILGNRVGRDNAIKMNELADIVCVKTRYLRMMINHLKFDHHIPIMSWDDPRQGGYYLPADAEDQAVCIAMFMSRIFTSLKNVATIKKISLIEAGELFAIELDKLKDSEEEAKAEFMRGLPNPPPGYSLITALIKHAQSYPEKYQEDLHRIQNIFGAKFIERKKLKDLAAIREKLDSICTELER